MSFNISVVAGRIEFRLGRQLLDQIEVLRSGELARYVLLMNDGRGVAVNKEKIDRIFVHLKPGELEMWRPMLHVNFVFSYIVAGYAQAHQSGPSVLARLKGDEKKWVLSAATICGHLWVVKNLLVDPRETADDELCSAIKNAADGGHLEVVKFLLPKGRKLPNNQLNDLVKPAIHGGHLEVVKFLLSKGASLTAAQLLCAIDMAASGGYLEMVEFLFSLPGGSSLPKDQLNNAIYNAASDGHVEVLEFLLTKSAPLTDDQFSSAVSTAAHGGHLKVVQLLLSGGRVPNQFSKVMFNAAHGGSLELIQWLLAPDRGMPTFDVDKAVTMASHGGHHEVVEFLLGRGAITGETKKTVLAFALENHMPEILDLLQYAQITSAQEAERAVDPRPIRLSFEDLKQKPLEHLHHFGSLDKFPAYFVDNDSTAIDMGRLTKQFVTLLMKSLVEQRIIPLSEMALPMIREAFAENDREIMRKLGHFYSLLEERNSTRSIPFTTGDVFHPTFFEIVRAVADESTEEKLVEKVVTALKNINPNFALTEELVLRPNEENKVIYADIMKVSPDEAVGCARQIVLQYVDAARFFYGAVSERFANKIKNTSPSILCIDIQGQRAAAEAFVRALHLYPDNPNPRFLEKIDWIKERIIHDKDDTWRKKFLRAVVGSDVLPPRATIRIKQGPFSIQICHSLLTIPATSDVSQEDYLQMLDSMLS